MAAAKETNLKILKEANIPESEYARFADFTGWRFTNRGHEVFTELLKYLIGLSPAPPPAIYELLIYSDDRNGSLVGTEINKVFHPLDRWDESDSRLLSVLLADESYCNFASDSLWKPFGEAIWYEKDADLGAVVVREFTKAGWTEERLFADVAQNSFWSIFKQEGETNAVSSLGRWFVKRISTDPYTIFSQFGFQKINESCGYGNNRIIDCILRADTALYLKLNERFGLDPKYITHDFQYYFKVDPTKWSTMAFADLPTNPYSAEAVLTCAKQLEKIAPGKLKTCLLQAYATTTKKKGDYAQAQKVILTWLLATDPSSTIPLFKDYKEKDLEVRTEVLVQAARVLRSEAIPILDPFLTIEALGKTKGKSVLRAYVSDVSGALVDAGADENLMNNIAKRFESDPVLQKAVLEAVKHKGTTTPTLAELVTSAAMKKTDWKERVILFLQLDRSQWRPKRERMELVCEKLLSLPAAIKHKDWPELVRIITDQTVIFKELAKKRLGAYVRPEDDETGLLEEYADEQMSTLDLAITLLSIPKTTSLPAWSALVLHTFEVKRMALGGISDSWDDLTKLLALPEANKNKDYDKIAAMAKKEFPGQRFS